MIFTAIFGAISQLASTWLTGKIKTSEAITEMKVAKAKSDAAIMEKQVSAEIDWDLSAIEGASTSWKDEWLLLLFSIPLIMAFVPGGEVHVQHGFDVLATMPEWYQISLGAMVAASFGMRNIMPFFKKDKK